MAVLASTVPRITQLRAAALFRFIAGFAILILLCYSHFDIAN
jgi:hypothetical protein